MKDEAAVHQDDPDSMCAVCARRGNVVILIDGNHPTPQDHKVEYTRSPWGVAMYGMVDELTDYWDYVIQGESRDMTPEMRVLSLKLAKQAAEYYMSELDEMIAKYEDFDSWGARIPRDPKYNDPGVHKVEPNEFNQ